MFWFGPSNYVLYLQPVCFGAQPNRPINYSFSMRCEVVEYWPTTTKLTKLVDTTFEVLDFINKVYQGRYHLQISKMSTIVNGSMNGGHGVQTTPARNPGTPGMTNGKMHPQSPPPAAQGRGSPAMPTPTATGNPKAASTPAPPANAGTIPGTKQVWNTGTGF